MPTESAIFAAALIVAGITLCAMGIREARRNKRVGRRFREMSFADLTIGPGALFIYGGILIVLSGGWIVDSVVN